MIDNEQVQEPEEANAPVEQNDENTESKGEVQPSEPVQTTGDKNWQQANQVLKLQKQKIEELEEKISQLGKKEELPEVDEFAGIDPEEYMTFDKAKKIAEKVSEKRSKAAAKEAVQEYAQQRVIKEDDDRCRGKFEDYDYVIDHFALPMIKNDPALAYKIQTSRNPAETAYRLAKLEQSMKEDPKVITTSPKAEKILKNAARPTSSNAVGTPLKAQGDQFAKMSKNDIWEQSQKYARGA